MDYHQANSSKIKKTNRAHLYFILLFSNRLVLQ
ncbi:Uncharacterised protein [Vibrio cholerae]|nr:Uncharacterised protein [Vibrio cholerae]